MMHANGLMWFLGRSVKLLVRFVVDCLIPSGHCLFVRVFAGSCLHACCVFLLQTYCIQVSLVPQVAGVKLSTA